MQSLQFYQFGAEFMPMDEWQSVVLVPQTFFLVKFHFMLI